MLIVVDSAVNKNISIVVIEKTVDLHRKVMLAKLLKIVILF